MTDSVLPVSPHAVIVDGVNFCVRLTRRSPGDVVFTIEIEGCCVGEVPWDNLVKANTRIDPDHASAPEKQIRGLRSAVARLRGQIIDQDILQMRLRDAEYAKELAEKDRQAALSELAHLRAVLKPRPEPRLPEIVKHVRDCPFGWVNGHVLTQRSATEDEVLAWLQHLFALVECDYTPEDPIDGTPADLEHFDRCPLRHATNDGISLPRPPREE